MEKVVKEAKISSAKTVLDIILTMFFLIGLPALIKDLTTTLTLTTTRLRGAKGLIRTRRFDSPLNKINGVEVRQSLLGKMFNYGTVVVVTASTVFYFEHIEDPDEFKEAVNNQIERCEEEKIARQAQKVMWSMR